MGFNPSQKLESVRRGDVARADGANHIIAALKRLIVGGNGIWVEPMGDQIRINANAQLIPVGTSAEGAAAAAGRYRCPTVEELPAVPTAADTYQMVFWTSADEGTGDDGVWWTHTDLDRWYPMIYSTLDGAPGEEELS